MSLNQTARSPAGTCAVHRATPVCNRRHLHFCAPFAVNNHSASVRAAAAAAAAAAAYKQSGCSQQTHRAGHRASCDYSLTWWHGNDGPSSDGRREGRLEREHGDKRRRRRKKKARNPPVYGAQLARSAGSRCWQFCWLHRKKKKKKQVKSRRVLEAADERKFLELNSRKR